MLHDMPGMSDTDDPHEMNDGDTMPGMETTTHAINTTNGSHDGHMPATMSSMQGHGMETEDSATPQAFVPHSVFR